MTSNNWRFSSMLLSSCSCSSDKREADTVAAEGLSALAPLLLLPFLAGEGERALLVGVAPEEASAACCWASITSKSIFAIFSCAAT